MRSKKGTWHTITGDCGFDGMCRWRCGGSGWHAAGYARSVRRCRRFIRRTVRRYN